MSVLPAPVTQQQTRAHTADLIVVSHENSGLPLYKLSIASRSSASGAGHEICPIFKLLVLKRFFQSIQLVLIYFRYQSNKTKGHNKLYTSR